MTDPNDREITIPDVPAEHLTYEELERWVDGKTFGAEEEVIGGHLDECAMCRKEADDLKRTRDTTRDLVFEEPSRGRSWLPLAAAAALIGGFVAVTLFDRDRPSPPPVKPPRVAPRVALEKPAIVAALAGDSSPLLGSEQKSFALLQPVGTVVADVRPLFRWKPMPGARSYDITVVDAQSGDVIAEGASGEPSWRPERPLDRMRTYSWQVISHHGKITIKAPTPPAPEALFRIEEISVTDTDPVTRGVRFANRGFLDDAERELAAAGATELLATVRSWRRGSAGF